MNDRKYPNPLYKSGHKPIPARKTRSGLVSAPMTPYPHPSQIITNTYATSLGLPIRTPPYSIISLPGSSQIAPNRNLAMTAVNGNFTARYIYKPPRTNVEPDVSPRPFHNFI